ncbi:hypothetical protein [Lysobacter capsici]|uniref:hypothetical protein n=1 Tax=Lysobacter capsici TaxID=435897 RepID=UPI0012901BAA|nr:hypothetical protein [Lysobacter capsici]
MQAVFQSNRREKIATDARIRRGPMVCLVSALLALAGCATAPNVEQIPPFRQGVVIADQQTTQAFVEINSFLRERQIDRVMLQPSISETQIVTVLAPEDVEKWHRAFGLMDKYARSVQALLDPKIRAGVEQELAGLGAAIGAVGDDQLPSGVAAGFSTLGGLLVQIKTQRDAMAAIRKADPGVQAVFKTMMAAIGEDKDDAIRGTVRSSWQVVLAVKSAQFLRASSEADKRAISLSFIATLDQRDARDLSLVSLRRSLGLLADAHAELAAGRANGARDLLALLRDEHARWADRQEQIEKARREEAAEHEGES